MREALATRDGVVGMQCRRTARDFVVLYDKRGWDEHHDNGGVRCGWLGGSSISRVACAVRLP